MKTKISKKDNKELENMPLHSTVSLPVEALVSKPLPQCCYLNGDGKRCRKRSAIKHRVHLDGELYSNYNFANWMEVNLCIEHFIAFGGTFNKKKKAC